MTKEPILSKPIRTVSRWYGKLAKDEIRGEALRTKLKMATEPGRSKERYALAKPFLSEEFNDFRRDGCLSTPLPGYSKLAPVFKQIVKEFEASDDKAFGSKKNLVNLLTVKHLNAHPEIMETVLDETFLRPVFNYYGYVPELASLALFHTPQNSDSEKSQLWHIDAYDPHHLKHITLVEDVILENGPFTFLKIPATQDIRQKSGNFKRGIDFESRFSNELSENIPHIGKQDEGMFVDVSNCLHQGGRTRQGKRVLFFIHFASFADYLVVEKNYKTGIYTQHEPALVKRFATTPIRRLMMRSIA